MSRFRAHIIHVGNMANKGTQALLRSDISIIETVTNRDVAFSVSTTDVEGVKRLNLPFDGIVSPMVDIPYEKADLYAKTTGHTRNSLRYKAFTVANLFYMLIQVLLSLLSVALIKVKLKPPYRSASLAHMEDCDVVISCSDENFKEGASMLPFNIYWVLTWWSMLLSRTSEILVAKLLGKPVVLFPNSVGPFRTVIGRSLSRIALNNCAFVLVREPISYDIVKSLKTNSFKILVSDTALTFNPTNNLSANGSSHQTIGVCPGIYAHSLSAKEVNEYISAHAKALDSAIEKYGVSVLFLPHYVSGFPYDDLAICRLISQKMKHLHKTTIFVANTVEEFKSTINRMDIVISSKMHPAVFAASAYVPTLCIAYDHKQTGFAMSLGTIDYVIPVREVTYEKLQTEIERIWVKRDHIKHLLKLRVPELQKGLRASVTQVLERVLNN